MSEVNDAPATRADLEKLEHRLDQKIDHLAAEMKAVEHRLDHKTDLLSADIKQLDLKLTAVEHRLDNKIDLLAAATQAGFAELRTEMAEQGKALRTEIAEVMERGIRILGEQLSGQLRAFD